MVYASTWEVYGEPQYEPVDENHPTEPDHPYSITKLGGERILISAAHLRGLSTVALRLGTAYGPGLRPNSVFRIFIDRARRGEPITIQGGGSQGRQFTHSDIARAFEIAARSDERPGVQHGRRRDGVDQTARRDGGRAHPHRAHLRPAPAGDVPSALVSSQKIADVLGWRPEMPFDQGLRHLIDEG